MRSETLLIRFTVLLTYVSRIGSEQDGLMTDPSLNSKYIKLETVHNHIYTEYFFYLQISTLIYLEIHTM